MNTWYSNKNNRIQKRKAVGFLDFTCNDVCVNYESRSSKSTAN